MIIITPDQKQLIETSNCAFATADSTGQPNCVAVGAIKVVSDNQILITDNFFNKTRKNITENNKVAFTVWSIDGETGYQYKGIVGIFTEGKWKQIVDQMPENQGSAHKAAILLTIKEIWDIANLKLVCVD